MRAAGYGAVPDAAAPARALRLAEQRAALWRLFVAGFCMMQVMMVASPAYFAEPGTLEPDHARLLLWASWVLTIPVVHPRLNRAQNRTSGTVHQQKHDAQTAK